MRQALDRSSGMLRPAFLGVVLCGASLASLGAPSADLEALRTRVLDDLFVLSDYRAGKNSFVASPERHIGIWTNQGFRYRLADLRGQGSLRHIWTTRGDGPPYFDWEFYVDGETNAASTRSFQPAPQLSRMKFRNLRVGERMGPGATLIFCSNARR